MRSPFNKPITRRTVWPMLVAVNALVLLTVPAYAQRVGNLGTRPAGAPPAPIAPAPAPRAWAPAGRPDFVDRFSHGSIRHAETHVVPRFDSERHFEGRVGDFHRHDIIVHHDFDAGFPRHHHFHDFVFHHFIPTLPLGFLTLQIGGAPYYYYDGIYYQPAPGGYQEVYPPVGAAVPEPPEGSIPIEAGGQTYYYAGGAFYLQQADGSYQIAPTPLGVIVPELPPGAVQVSLSDGSVAYQFNGVYYRPVFVNGITQYQTFMPQ